MFGMTMAEFIPADIEKEPHSVLLGNGANTSLVDDIQLFVGGTFDVVRMQAVNEETLDTFTLIGYVHDEGILLDMPMNVLASSLFGRELYGDVLVLSGTNPENGDYDGDSYDLPMNFCEYIEKVLYPETCNAVAVSRGLAGAFMIAHRDGIVSDEERDYVTEVANLKAKQSLQGDFRDMPKRWQEIMERAIRHMVTLMDDGDEAEEE